MSNGACYFGSTLPFHLWCKQAALLRGQWCVDMPEKLNLITINQVFVSLLTSCCWTIGGRKLLILTGKFPPRFWRRGRHDLMSLIPEVCVWPIQLDHCYVWEQALETGLNCSPDAAINIQTAAEYETPCETTTNVFYVSVCLLNKHNSVARTNVGSVQQTCLKRT